MRRSSKINHSRSFGSEQVTPQERDRRMLEIFQRLAPHYDRLLDMQTLGLHRYWRQALAHKVKFLPGQRLLDVAGGCGEMARRFASRDREVIVLEPSIPMINVGRSRGFNDMDWVAGLARALPFPEGSMDIVVCAFAIRNVTYVEAALTEIFRVLKSGARLYCLEASRPWAPIRPIYRVFCRYMVPLLGAWVTRDPEAYDYLVDSIREFPDRKDIKSLFENMGFSEVHYHSLTFGIACIHVGTKSG